MEPCSIECFQEGLLVLLTIFWGPNHHVDSLTLTPHPQRDGWVISTQETFSCKGDDVNYANIVSPLKFSWDVSSSDVLHPDWLGT